MANQLYVITATYNGTEYILQMRGILNWYFYNNRAKVFKTLVSAKKNAHKVLQDYKVSQVHILALNEDDEISSCECKRYYNTDKEVLVLTK